MLHAYQYKSECHINWTIVAYTTANTKIKLFEEQILGRSIHCSDDTVSKTAEDNIIKRSGHNNQEGTNRGSRLTTQLPYARRRYCSCNFYDMLQLNDLYE